MAAAFEAALGESGLRRLVGQVNVPDDCVRPLRRIRLCGCRPAGVNEPTAEGVRATRRILRLVSSLADDDVLVVLLSGGGSALLPAPAEGLSLQDKLAITRLLMAGGVPIEQLNCVRRHLSAIKGGRLVCQAGAGRIVTLIISDVIGDRLDVIASGPTVPDPTTPQEALAVLQPFADRVPSAVLSALAGPPSAAGDCHFERVSNHIIGNNDTARLAASRAAARLGYHVVDLGSDNAGRAEDVGLELAERARAVRDSENPVAPPVCFLSGGEPVVHLPPTNRARHGGRNQQVALAAACRLRDECQGIAVLSGGTDGEDGPTDAAGAVVTCDVWHAARRLQLSADQFLSDCNAYPFLDATGGLFRTGPTHTNVMDLRVVLIAGDQPDG